MATAKGGGEAVLERSVAPCSDQQKGLEFNLDYHGYSSDWALDLRDLKTQQVLQISLKQRLFQRSLKAL